MQRDDFDKDLNDYLRTRKGAGVSIKAFLERVLPKKKPVEMPEQVEVYEPKASKPSMIERFNTWRKTKKTLSSSEEFARETMRADDATHDLKEVSKIMLGVVRTLPDDHLSRFKQSAEFERLKVILKKHDLIK